MTQRLVSSARPRVLTTSGKCGLIGLAVAAVFTIAAFSTTNWIQSDPRIYGSKLDRLGLWVHCFRSLADHNDPSHQKFFAGCRWIFDPFTEGYPDLKNFLSPRKFWNWMETKVLIKNYGEDSDQLYPFLVNIFQLPKLQQRLTLVPKKNLSLPNSEKKESIFVHCKMFDVLQSLSVV